MIDDIRELLDAEPFRAFVLTVTGLDVEFEVEHPRQVTIPTHGETIHLRDRHNERRVIAVRHITTIRMRKERLP
jgi:hypothetical protein